MFSSIWQLLVWAVAIGLTVLLTFSLGPVGFIIGLVLCAFQASSFNRRKRNKQHKELIDALKNK